jgi:hypothetical protein
LWILIANMWVNTFLLLYAHGDNFKKNFYIRIKQE